MKQWARWEWGEYDNDTEFQSNSYTGALSKALWEAKSPRRFELTPKIRKDIESRFEFTIERLKLNESVAQMVDTFIENDFIEALLLDRRKK
ncbi:hypothetical protein [Pseudodesulfovibrio sp. S3]|uniref:hypothetical protein n=2 Tax=unclassified Pseudodesulfovibrio TaxID=2661612 RepID=UPI0019D4C833|nr:hypothetical protein [Pseudodesulfovibrio sp. S3]MCJ2163563.1 hypothetical protein [Pseudodesulfovibrio sp. S3-i]